MQWNSEKYAGFSSVNPWLPVHPDRLLRNVEIQKNDPDSLYHFTRKLIQIRKENNALTSGTYSKLETDNDKVMAYLRETNDQTVLVILNFSSKKEIFQIKIDMESVQWLSLLEEGLPFVITAEPMELLPYAVSLYSNRK